MFISLVSLRLYVALVAGYMCGVGGSESSRVEVSQFPGVESSIELGLSKV